MESTPLCSIYIGSFFEYIVSNNSLKMKINSVLVIKTNQLMVFDLMTEKK